uniref:Uncharacterized protein n=1 Tax=Steinernema glaseri TaxID=37863 RepID=A0A1I8A8Z5_9BILA
MATLSSYPSTETEYSEDDVPEVSEASDDAEAEVVVYGPADYKDKFDPTEYLNFYYSKRPTMPRAKWSSTVPPTTRTSSTRPSISTSTTATRPCRRARE